MVWGGVVTPAVKSCAVVRSWLTVMPADAIVPVAGSVARSENAPTATSVSVNRPPPSVRVDRAKPLRSNSTSAFGTAAPAAVLSDPITVPVGSIRTSVVLLAPAASAKVTLPVSAVPCGWAIVAVSVVVPGGRPVKTKAPPDVVVWTANDPAGPLMSARTVAILTMAFVCRRTRPRTTVVLLNTTSRAAPVSPTANCALTMGANRPVVGCIAPRTNASAGMATDPPLSARTPVNANAPVPLLDVCHVRANSGWLVVSRTVADAIGVPSAASARPLTNPVSSGSGARLLEPSAGNAKFRVSTISSPLRPANASGGSCAKRSAAAWAGPDPVSCTPKCTNATDPPAGTATAVHSASSTLRRPN